MRRDDGTEAKMIAKTDGLAAKPIYAKITPVKMLVAIGSALLVGCMNPPTHVGVMPVQGPGSLKIYNPGFSEGFARWSLVDKEIESSNSPGDFFILAAVVLSLIPGVVGGIVEEIDEPPKGQLAEALSAVRETGPHVDIAEILRQEIVKELRRVAAGSADAPYHFVERVEPIDQNLESYFDPWDSRVGVLEVEIEQIVVSPHWAKQPLAPITLTASARIRFPHSGEGIAHQSLSAGDRWYSVDWPALNAGDMDRFSQSIEIALEASAKSLAAVIVEAFWGQRKR
jgi:hypothetical protein